MDTKPPPPPPHHVPGLAARAGQFELPEDLLRDADLKARRAISGTTPIRRAAVAVLPPEEHRLSDEPYGIGIAFEGQAGYMPWRGLRRDSFATHDEAVLEADHINTEVFKLTAKEAHRIVASSMAADRPERLLRETLDLIEVIAQTDLDDEQAMRSALQEIRSVVAKRLYGRCQECNVPEHDVCPGTSGCPCCSNGAAS